MLKKLGITAMTLLSCTVLSMPTFAAKKAAEQNQVEKFVSSAIDEIKANGKDAAMKEFNDPHGKFTQGSNYIFAFDYDGILLASPNNHELVGKAKPEKDKNGMDIEKELIDKAKNGGGWVSYHWKNPATKKVQCKMSYVMPVDNSYLVGSGYYTSEKNCK